MKYDQVAIKKYLNLKHSWKLGGNNVKIKLITNMYMNATCHMRLLEIVFYFGALRFLNYGYTQSYMKIGHHLCHILVTKFSHGVNIKISI